MHITLSSAFIHTFTIQSVIAFGAAERYPTSVKNATDSRNGMITPRRSHHRSPAGRISRIVDASALARDVLLFLVLTLLTAPPPGSILRSPTPRAAGPQKRTFSLGRVQKSHQ